MDVSMLLMAIRRPAEIARHGHLADRSDASIIEGVLEGDGDASEELVRRYWGDCARSALLVIGDEGHAEDAAQEAFVSALGSLQTFDRSRPFAPWLHRIVINKAIDRSRKPARHREDLRQDEFAPPSGAEPAYSDLGGEVLAAINELDPVDRAMLVARHVLGYRAVEIAEWLDVPAGTVRVRLHRASIRVQLLVGGDFEARDANSD